jgi:polyphosphate glucokinase
MDILGIDIGGSGIKGAPVDIRIGQLATERHRLATPQPSTPGRVAAAVAEVAAHFHWNGPIGCTFPAVVKQGVVRSAANVDPSWLGVDGRKLLQKKTGCHVRLLNDADAAGMAEMQFGAGRRHEGVVFVLTFGTGIGSAIFVDGVLMPNTELGHIKLRCRKRGAIDAEDYASDRARKQGKLKWKDWARRVSEYLHLLEALFSPDLLIMGGGVSKKHEKFLPLLKAQAEVVPAQLLNDAGIVGAALAARE